MKALLLPGVAAGLLAAVALVQAQVPEGGAAPVTPGANPVTPGATPVNPGTTPTGPGVTPMTPTIVNPSPAATPSASPTGNRGGHEPFPTNPPTAPSGVGNTPSGGGGRPPR